ncbi:ImmA/IrrE family metallo-endopeptidase [Mycobacterium sp. ACS4331]|uniref:ImmA/IrrE family metallo-endopeptidase n=1 Tax=Mycobacterium sp. ACS4331 TaxID=1834121 RepID=UPI00336A691E
MHGDTEFVWRDEAKYKNLGATTPAEQGVLTSFGVAIGKALIAVAPPPVGSLPPTAEELRTAILKSGRLVGLTELLTFCWAVGVAVVQLEVFPLSAKRMHAMTVKVGDRYAILLGSRSSYPAQASFVVAHELGHIAGGHLGDSAALLDVEDPLDIANRDDEEAEADKYALSLLTGSAELSVLANTSGYNATQVAHAAIREAFTVQIEPGTLALCLAYSTGNWKQSLGALKIIYGTQPTGAAGSYVNNVARTQLDLSSLNDRNRYISRVLNLGVVG